MAYKQMREDILHYLRGLQANGLSYQSICDFINGQQTDFVLYKDFFSRFQSNPKYYTSTGKGKKLTIIRNMMQDLYQQNLTNEYLIKEYLSTTIHHAAQARFEAYLEISRATASLTNNLPQWYREQSPALIQIEQSIRHKRQYEWELDLLNYGSNFEILSIEVSNLFQHNAVIKTEEFWRLSWVDKRVRRLQFKFETLGQHIYLLIKDEAENWKIAEDISKSPMHKIEPEYIDYPALAALVSRQWKENKTTAINFIAEDELLHCIAFLKTNGMSELSAGQFSILDRIRQNCLKSHQLLNTDVISYTEFRSEINLLKKQLQLIVESIFLGRK